MDQGYVELGLYASGFLQLAVESGFVGGDGAERCFEDVEDLGFLEGDGNELERLLLLGNWCLL